MRTVREQGLLAALATVAWAVACVDRWILGGTEMFWPLMCCCFWCSNRSREWGERRKRIAAENENEALEAAYLLVIRDVNEAFGVGRAIAKARTGRKEDVS